MPVLDIRQDIVMNIVGQSVENENRQNRYEPKIFSRNIRVFFLVKSSGARSEYSPFCGNTIGLLLLPGVLEAVFTSAGKQAILAGAQAFRGSGAPKSPYMRPQPRRQDLSNLRHAWTLSGV